MTEQPEPVRLVVLGDVAGAPVCEGDACYLPPPADETPQPAPVRSEAAAPDRPQ